MEGGAQVSALHTILPHPCTWVEQGLPDSLLGPAKTPVPYSHSWGVCRAFLGWGFPGQAQLYPARHCRFLLTFPFPPVIFNCLMTMILWGQLFHWPARSASLHTIGETCAWSPSHREIFSPYSLIHSRQGGDVSIFTENKRKNRGNPGLTLTLLF